jgi:hypothetical protein
MTMALPDYSRSVGDTTPSEPLTGARAREGKRANLLLDWPEHYSDHGLPGPRRQPFSREFRYDTKASG